MNNKFTVKRLMNFLETIENKDTEVVITNFTDFDNSKSIIGIGYTENDKYNDFPKVYMHRRLNNER